MRGQLTQADLCWDTVVIGDRHYHEYPLSKGIIQNILEIRDKVASSVNLFHNEIPTRELLAKLKSARK